MYKITRHADKHTVEIHNTSLGFYAKIYLNCGGSLQELMVHKLPIIADLEPLSYENTYASAILFPFANRIKDGRFRFKEQSYQLNINNKKENHALHGLVYDKYFTILSQMTNADSAQLTLNYDYNKLESGFPFPFNIQLKYTFTSDGVDLNVLVENKAEKSFPFTIGWHPYFLSEDLNNSSIDFKSRLKLHTDDRNIGTDLQDVLPLESLSLKTKNLDDCWQLEEDSVVFKTPTYNLSLASSEANSFLQIYTPPKKNTVAIEPTTGVSDSFNNDIGLKVLKPKQRFDITWSLKIDLN